MAIYNPPLIKSGIYICSSLKYSITSLVISEKIAILAGAIFPYQIGFDGTRLVIGGTKPAGQLAGKGIVTVDSLFNSYFHTGNDYGHNMLYVTSSHLRTKSEYLDALGITSAYCYEIWNNSTYAYVSSHKPGTYQNTGLLIFSVGRSEFYSMGYFLSNFILYLYNSTTSVPVLSYLLPDIRVNGFTGNAADTYIGTGVLGLGDLDSWGMSIRVGGLYQPYIAYNTAGSYVMTYIALTPGSGSPSWYGGVYVNGYLVFTNFSYVFLYNVSTGVGITCDIATKIPGVSGIYYPSKVGNNVFFGSDEGDTIGVYINTTTLTVHSYTKGIYSDYYLHAFEEAWGSIFATSYQKIGGIYHHKLMEIS